MRKKLQINDKGLRVGEDHQRAKLTDAEVEAIRTLHDEGFNYAKLAEKFEISKVTVGRICRYERRAQTIAGFVEVHIPDE